MIGPFEAMSNGRINYLGNNIFPKLMNYEELLNINSLTKHIENLFVDEFWNRITVINDRIIKSSFNFFSARSTTFINLPLTTRMISSPGAVYGKEKIDYTTDTCPITLKWFDLPDEAYLAESSQIYLELALAQKNMSEVFSIYNSFRKEEADFCHLSEFHHIEFEAKIEQEENINVIKDYINILVSDLLNFCSNDLLFFINREYIKFLEDVVLGKGIVEMSFNEALKILYKNTGNEKYKNFTMNNQFGSWEEIKLTNILNSFIIIREYPLFEVPFYHAKIENSTPEKANNADFIWPGYREFIGSGQRIGNLSELKDKSEIFNLPIKDYSPYLKSRQSPYYKTSSGFGMGLERFIQGILCLPSIHLSTLFPRTHLTLYP